MGWIERSGVTPSPAATIRKKEKGAGSAKVAGGGGGGGELEWWLRSGMASSGGGQPTTLPVDVPPTLSHFEPAAEYKLKKKKTSSKECLSILYRSLKYLLQVLLNASSSSSISFKILLA